MGEAVIQCHGIMLTPCQAEETNAEARFKINGVKKILFYCNRVGMFFINVMKGIDDKQTAYDDAEERRKLEQAAKMLFT